MDLKSNSDLEEYQYIENFEQIGRQKLTDNGSRSLWHGIYQSIAKNGTRDLIDQNKYGVVHGFEIYFNYGKV